MNKKSHHENRSCHRTLLLSGSEPPIIKISFVEIIIREETVLRQTSQLVTIYYHSSRKDGFSPGPQTAACILQVQSVLPAVQHCCKPASISPKSAKRVKMIRNSGTAFSRQCLPNLLGAPYLSACISADFTTLPYFSMSRLIDKILFFHNWSR
jgi:hypothetical protein